MGSAARKWLDTLREWLQQRELAGGTLGQPSTPDEPVDQFRNPAETVAGHQATIGPSGIARSPNAIKTGEEWKRVHWVAAFPDAPGDGLFEQLYATPVTRATDISLHLQPRDPAATLDALEHRIEDLEADVEYLADKRRASARGVRQDLEEHQRLYDALHRSPTRPFDVSMFLVERADDREAFNTPLVRKQARQAPANLSTVVPRYQQALATTAGSPVGDDALQDALDTKTPMLAEAVATMFPFVAGSFAEPGVEFGTDAQTGSPVILDRFQRSTGYCMMVIGQLGAGKSFSTKLQLVRRAMLDPETTIVMLDPMGGFAGLSEALGGERITVGGTRGLNPLELRPTPPEVLRTVPDIDPWSEQVSRVMSFFDRFFSTVAGHPLDDRTQTLRRAIQHAYTRVGITPDPATHDRQSPTIRTVIAVLETMTTDPGDFGYTSSNERSSVAADAGSLLTDLRPSFREGGDLANLARETTFNLDDHALYLDLTQAEGARGRSATGLMMQVLFNAVYERAKTTDDRVVFAIDEAHYLLSDPTSLSFLETAVRHSRHYDLSLQFITQTGGEFTLTPEARTIATLCSMTLVHRVREAAGKLADWFDLNDRQTEWVRTASAGTQAVGYSEALLHVDEVGWFPIRVRASEPETAVITD